MKPASTTPVLELRGLHKTYRLGQHVVPALGEADMLWRTSGENRLSNFMLWQSAYAELVFTDILWPDVDRLALWKAIETYAARDRRFGNA